MAQKKYIKKNNKSVNIFKFGGLEGISPIKPTDLPKIDVGNSGLSFKAKGARFIQGLEDSGIPVESIGEGIDMTFQSIASLMDKTKSDTELVDAIGLNGNTYAGGGALGWAKFGVDNVTSIVDDINKAKGRDVSELKDSIIKGGNIKVASGNFDDIMAQRGLMGEFNHISAKDLGQKNFGQALLSSSGEAASGFAKGLSTGNIWGGIIGGAISGIGDAFSSIFSNKANRKKAKEINELVDRANIQKNFTYNQALENTEKQQYFNVLSNISAYGGPIFNDFSNGVSIIGNGGSHENNPFEGVQVGIDPQGVPNLVEEGEVIFNDYVFSNRLQVPDAIRSKYKLRGNKDLTFADAAKQIQKESEERPNDPISKRGLEDSLMKLMTIQEQLRQDNNKKQFSNGGNLFYNGSKLNSYKNFTALPENTDFYDEDYLAFWDWMNTNRTDQKAIDWLNRINNKEFGEIGGNTFSFDDILRLAKDYKKGPVHNAFYEASRAFNKENSKVNPNVNVSIEKDFMDRFNVTPSRLSLSKGMQTPSEVITQRPYVGNEDDYTPVAPINMHPLRYSSTVGQFASVLNNLLGGNDPDYSNLAGFENAARNIRAVNHTPVGNYLMYNPFDRNYYQNMLTASSNATRRAARNVSGGNRAQALAGILAADYNEGIKLGELARQAEEYNLARRQQVEDFNRATNMFNSELGFKAGATNAELDARRAALLGEVARMRELERMSNRKEKIDANTAFLTSLDNIGKEKTYMDMLRWMEETGVLESKKGY